MSKGSKSAAFAKALDFHMRRVGINGKELSAEIGVPEPTISRWRSGDRLPQKSKILLVADFFGVEPESMTSGMIQIPTYPLVLDEFSSDKGLRDKCIAQMGAFLHIASQQPDGLEWTWDELQKRFPLDKWTRDP